MILSAINDTFVQIELNFKKKKKKKCDVVSKVHPNAICFQFSPMLPIHARLWPFFVVVVVVVSFLFFSIV